MAAFMWPYVFTNGVFDIIHADHVSYLARARSIRATLIVGLNADVSVRMLGKGGNRPLNSERDRAIVLSALEAVDLVTVFHERTPMQLVERIRPDIYVKGGDYDIDQLDEAKLVRSWGGTAYALPFIEGHSTTTLVARIMDAP